ncbi:MAG TPA: Hsp20/alpha crystallin family protein [Flavobacteriaceae bacterium]|nr:Hsp20/alpha crystallin family protein [Flavobacteriaceae bacterium]
MSLARKDNWLPAVFDDIFNQDWLSEIDRTQRIGKSVPAVNVKETDDNFVVEVAAPGMKKEDFSIELDNKMLTVSSEIKEEHVSENEDEQFTRKEFSYASFSRSFTLPESVDNSKISADYADGVLKIDLPKREEAKTEAKRKIEIK